MNAQSTTSSQQVRQMLARPESYPDRPTEVGVRETHISWVFLAGDRAYKLKKPLVLDFLDYGTPERRRKMCEEEVRLNRRLAPDIYLGVRGVALTDGAAVFTEPTDPRAVDFVVEMRRYDEGSTLAARLERGEVGRGEVERTARALARFHAAAPSRLDLTAPVLAVERHFDQNLQELLARVEQRAVIGCVQALERFSHAFITRHAETFRGRAAEGRVREGHGDLRAEHILVDGEVQIVDCVEFDLALRQLDVADDLAFLVLDLVTHGAERLARTLTEAYRAAGGDPGGEELISFYAAHRALVRAKVELVRTAQLSPESSAYARESAAARELIALAERFAWRARLPLIIAVCGVPASGKSHLASAIAELAHLPHLSSDLTRKQLARIGPTQRAPEDRYNADWNARTYVELAHRATQSAERSGGAIVDGTFRHASDRQAFAAALGTQVPVLFVECRAPRGTLAQRAASREHDSHRVSDAGVAVVLRELESWEPLDEVPARSHIALRTDRPVDEVVGDFMALLDRHLQDP